MATVESKVLRGAKSVNLTVMFPSKSMATKSY